MGVITETTETTITGIIEMVGINLRKGGTEKTQRTPTGETTRREGRRGKSAGELLINH
jgi:hypothetical protein